jgi:hypothetical protein
VVHYTKVVIGVCIPRALHLQRPGGFTAIRVAQVREDAGYSPWNSSIGLKGEALVRPAIVEFNPPPAMSNNGKPEPICS